MVDKLHSNLDDDDVTRINTENVEKVVPLKSNDYSSQSPKTPLEETLKPSTSSSSFVSYNTAFHGESELELGNIIKNTYELVAILGEGGMGTVFKAINKVWEEVEARDPYVAIKVLKPELSENKELVRSLYSDFDRTKMLANCPNIIKVYGFDRDGPHVYMTMEYLTGQTLGDYLNRQPMSLAQAWPIIEGIGNALDYAHKNNIVHRDIKPGNIIITQEGNIKVLDFGIASKINENEGDETKFGGHELGAFTTAYASPEMQRDFPPDARDDIYAFACVIYEILTGKQFYKQKIHKAGRIQGLNSRQLEALNRGLAFERDLRAASIPELLQKLKPIKTPWVKFILIGIILLAITSAIIIGFEKSKQPELIAPATPVVSETSKAPLVPNQIQPPKADVSTIVPQKTDSPTLSNSTQIDQKSVPVQQIDEEPNYYATSKDGLIYIHTSQADYKNGEPFSVNFTLQKPMYVRVIDRDTKGVLTTLRPNPKQLDKIIPANREQSFPPKGVNVPVNGLAGKCTVTIIASTEPFANNKLINEDGTVVDAVKNGLYSWAQVRYTLR
jgi:serine/threonine protein kinase